MQIKFDANKKKLDTNPVFGLLVQGENLAESIQITGPKMVGALDLSQLRVAVRMTSQQYETTVEKTLEQTTDGDTITFTWQVDKQFTGSPGKVDVMLVGYGGNEEVIKITSSGMVVQEDRTFDTAPPESTWEQILQQMQDFATQAYESKTAAANSAAEAAASQKVAEEKAEQATNAASEAVKAAEIAATDAAAQAAAKTEQQIRQYADDRYARALQGTADPAASITIYPDAGSNVAATAHGFTVQEGSGDASPVNVRPIVNGGLKLVEYKLTGNESYIKYSNGIAFSRVFSGTLNNPKAYCTDFYQISTGNKKQGAFWFGYGDANVYCFINPEGTAVTDEQVQAFKAEAQARYAAGDPITFWCQPTDESQATGLYVPLTGTGDGHTGVCGKLTAPLCQGDKLITKVKSGCDVEITFDGSEDEGWSVNSGSSEGAGGSKRFTIKIQKASQNSQNGTLGVAYSDTLPQATPGQTYGTGYDNTFSVQNANVQIRIAGISTVEALREYLAAKPSTIRYKSTVYTEDNDIVVSLETHVRWVLIADGSYNVDDSANLGNVTRGRYIVAATFKSPNGYQDDSKCSHFKGGNRYTTNEQGFYVNNEPYFFISNDLLSETNATGIRNFLKTQNSQGTPVQVEYPLRNPITFAHDPVDFIANPDEDGAWVITGEANGKVSAVFNKNITHTIAELQAALLAVSAKLSL